VLQITNRTVPWQCCIQRIILEAWRLFSTTAELLFTAWHISHAQLMSSSQFHCKFNKVLVFLTSKEPIFLRISYTNGDLMAHIWSFVIVISSAGSKTGLVWRWQCRVWRRRRVKSHRRWRCQRGWGCWERQLAPSH